MDTIHIKGLRLFAYHGVNPEEKRDGQTFVLDLRLGADLSRARRSDRLEDTVNYAAVVKAVRAPWYSSRTRPRLCSISRQCSSRRWGFRLVSSSTQQLR